MTAVYVHVVFQNVSTKHMVLFLKKKITLFPRCITTHSQSCVFLISSSESAENNKDRKHGKFTPVLITHVQAAAFHHKFNNVQSVIECADRCFTEVMHLQRIFWPSRTQLVRAESNSTALGPVRTLNVTNFSKLFSAKFFLKPTTPCWCSGISSASSQRRPAAMSPPELRPYRNSHLEDA